MSLDDITLNTRVYTVTSVAGSRVLRAVLATGEANYPTVLELSHTPGVGNKPNRHLAKITSEFQDADGVPFPMTLHVVATQPKGSGSTDFSPINEDITDLLLTSGFLGRWLAGGFD